MRNAALILGIIGGLAGMVVGFFGYLFAWAGETFDEAVEIANQAGVAEAVENPMMIKLISVVAPILAIAGAAMAPSRPAIAAILLIVATVGMYWAFSFNLFTMFPIGMCGIAVLLAVIGALVPPVQAHH